MRRLEAEGEELAAIADPRALDPRQDYAPILAILDRIARDMVARRMIRVRVLGGRRPALVLRGRPRCAYCHDEVSGSEDGLVACNLCATVIHQECWDELGHCAVLGCEGAILEDLPRKRLVRRRKA